MSPSPDQLRTEIETLEAELNEMSNGPHVGIGFFRDRVNQAISDIVGPKDALSYNQNLWIAHLSGGAAYLPR